jgi:hypothetical protein
MSLFHFYMDTKIVLIYLYVFNLPIGKFSLLFCATALFVVLYILANKALVNGVVPWINGWLNFYNTMDI